MHRRLKVLGLGTLAVFLFIFGGSGETPAQVHVNLNIGPPIFSFPHPPQVAVIPGTYVYGVPGVDVDILFYHGRWYRPHGGHWFYARSYNGPWVRVAPGRVPGPLLRLPPPGHRFPPGHRPMHYSHVKANWKKWERERHWHGDREWQGRGGGGGEQRGRHEEHGGGHRGGRG